MKTGGRLKKISEEKFLLLKKEPDGNEDKMKEKYLLRKL